MGCRVRIELMTGPHAGDKPKLFYEEFGGGSVSRVAQHFDRLCARSSWLEKWSACRFLL
jgi:hypothetical protein